MRFREEDYRSQIWQTGTMGLKVQNGTDISASNGGGTNYITTNASNPYIAGTSGFSFGDGSVAYKDPTRTTSEENFYYANKIVKIMTAAHPHNSEDKIPMCHTIAETLYDIDSAEPLKYIQLLDNIDDLERGVKRYVLQDSQAEEPAQGFFSRVFGTKRQHNEDQFSMNTYVELCRGNGARSFFIFSQDALNRFLPQIEEMGKIATYLSGDTCNYNIGVGLLTHYNNG